MAEKPDSMVERMKKMPLWQWGGCFIFGGVFTNLAAQLVIDAGDMPRAEARATQLGAAFGGGFLILAGLALIVMHFVRRRN